MRRSVKFIFFLATMCILLSPGYAIDQQFSMQIQDRSLADVFKDLTKMSGHRIAFDKQWADQPISIRFVNLTLEKAITKILTNLNHVIIYEQDNIRVKIYGAVSSDKNMNPTPMVRQSNGAPSERKIRPLARPLPKSAQQDKNTDESTAENTGNSETVEMEDTESTSEAIEEPQPSEAQNTESESEVSEAEDTENTDEIKTDGEQERADETETSAPDDDLDDKTDDESS